MNDPNKDANIEARLKKIIEDCREVAHRSAEINAGIRTIPRLKFDLDVPPACLDTREGMAAFRQMLPSVRVVFRAGGWGRLAPLARLWLAYCLCRAVPALNVRESWKLVRAK